MDVADIASKYSEERASQLDKLDGDVRAERGLGTSLSGAAAAAQPMAAEPPDGAEMTPDGDVVGKGEREGAAAAVVLRTRLVGMGALRKRAATAAPPPISFDNGGTPFTIADLRGCGCTPDVDVDGRAGAAAAGGEDLGQCLNRDWFSEAAGADMFENPITAALDEECARSAAFGAAAFGAARAEAPADRSQQTAAAISMGWALQRRAGAVGAAELDALKARAAEYCEAAHEAVEVAPQHVWLYLFEAAGRERPCLFGDACAARRCLPHPKHDAPPASHPGGPSSRTGVTLKEFLTPAEREVFEQRGTLPEVRGPCIACIRDQATFMFEMAWLGVVRYAPQTHYHPVDVPGGYRRSACLQPRKSSGASGAWLPTRGFATDEYGPTTLADAVRAGLVPADACRWHEVADVAGVRGYFERGSVMYSEATRDLDQQAVSVGTEPMYTYAAALALSENNKGGGGAGSSSSCSRSPKPGERTWCCDLGQHDGRWRHLVIEAAARLGITTETMSVVFGPSCELCQAIGAALRADASSELAALARQRREWALHGPPEPLAKHTLYAGAVLCCEIAEDLRWTVVTDAVEVARRKTAVREAAACAEAVAAAVARPGPLHYDTWERLADDAEDESGFAQRSDELMQAYAEGREGWEARKRRALDDAAQEARKRFEARLVPHPQPTAAQRAITERISAASDSALKALLAERQKKTTQRTMDRVLQAVSEFDSAHKPLLCALLRLREMGLPLDDAALLGRAAAGAGDAAAMLRSSFGCVDPDSRTPLLAVPRRPHRLTITASAATAARAAERRFAESGLPRRCRPPAPAPFLVPDVPVCKVRFPSHRQALRRALLAGALPSLGRSGGCPDPPAPPAATLLKEFWKAVAAVRDAGPGAEREIARWLGTGAGGAAFFSEKAEASLSRGGRHAIALTALARVVLAERAQQAAGSRRTLAFRAHAFAMTHSDLLWGIDWVGGDWSDDALLRSGAADAGYPYDGRAFTEEDMVPISGDLPLYGFFDQASDPECSMTLEHVLRKVVPRACEKRDLNKIIKQALGASPAFSVWLMGAVRCFLMGSYAHARRRPSIELQLRVCEPFLRQVGKDLELRLAEADARPLALKRQRKCAKMAAAAAALGPQQFWGALAAADALEAAGACVTLLGGANAGAETYDSEPFFAAARRARLAVATSVCRETARRLSESDAADDTAVPTPQGLVSLIGPLRAGRIALREVAGGAALEESVRLLGEGGLSSPSSEVAEESAAIIASTVAGEKVMAAVAEFERGGPKHTLSDVGAFEKRLADAAFAALIELSETGMATRCGGGVSPGPRTWPLSPESVREVCAAACSRALEEEIAAEGDGFMSDLHGQCNRQEIADAFCRKLVTAAADPAAVDPALVTGLASVALSSMAPRAGDVTDVCDPAVKMACWYDDPKKPRRRTRAEKCRVILAAAEAARRLGSNEAARLLEADLLDAVRDRSRGSRAALASDGARMSRVAGAALGCVSAARGAQSAWGRPPPPPPAAIAIAAGAAADLTPDLLTMLAGRLVATVVATAYRAAAAAIACSDSMTKSELLRASWERHCRVAAQLETAESQAFWKEHKKMYQFAVREQLVAQASRSPALMAAFVTRGAWFPEFFDSVRRACDGIRGFVAGAARIPTRAEARKAAGGAAWWSGTVYRVPKCGRALAAARAADQHMAEIVGDGYVVGPAFRVDPKRVRLMREYVYATADGVQSVARDCEVLRMFGVREHGLDVVRRLGASYDDHFAGCNEFYRILNQASVSEFLLIREYYRALVAANSVSAIPLLCPSISEATAAALRERNGLGNGRIPRETLEFVVCDVCNAVHTQVSARTSTRPSKLTSCCGVVIGQTGELVCLAKRKSAKKRAPSSVEDEGEEEEEEEEEESDDDDVVADLMEDVTEAAAPHPATAAHAEQDQDQDAAQRGLRLTLRCQETRVRQIPSGGCIIWLSQKRTAKGEKSSDAKCPVVIRAPCCGAWRRYSSDDWGPGGYRCRACSYASGTGPALPAACAVCGRAISSPQRQPASARKLECSVKQMTTVLVSGIGATGTGTWASSGLGLIRWAPLPVRARKCQRASELPSSRQARNGRKRRAGAGDAEPTEEPDADDPLEGSFILIRSKNKRNIYETSSTVSGVDGQIVPVSDACQCVVCVLEDEATLMAVPVGVCMDCFFEHSRLRGRSGAAVAMSMLRASVSLKLEEPRQPGSARRGGREWVGGAGWRKK